MKAQTIHVRGLRWVFTSDWCCRPEVSPTRFARPNPPRSTQCWLAITWSVIGSPRTDSAVALAAATTNTSIAIGWWVLLPALRPLAWAFKVVTSLQHESGGRVSSASESVGASEDRMPQKSGRQQNNPLGAARHAPTGSPTLLPHALAGRPISLGVTPTELHSRTAVLRGRAHDRGLPPPRVATMVSAAPAEQLSRIYRGAKPHRPSPTTYAPPDLKGLPRNDTSLRRIADDAVAEDFSKLPCEVRASELYRNICRRA